MDGSRIDLEKCDWIGHESFKSVFVAGPTSRIKYSPSI
jgi:hypothetical protein